MKTTNRSGTWQDHFEGWILVIIVIAMLMMTVIPAIAIAGESEVAGGKPEKGEKSVAWGPAVEPKPISNEASKGLAWLVEHQHGDGGWSQGEESTQMGNSMDHRKDKLRGGGPKRAVFRADHPFTFLIRDNQTNSLLFIGRVVDPTAQGV